MKKETWKIPRRQTKFLRTGQRGMALITVLLVSGLVSIMSVSMISRQQIEIRRTANVIDGDQSLILARGVEAWGRRVLASDEDKQSDHLAEAWAVGLPPTEVEGGMVAGFVEDMQGRFNLNNLITTNQDLLEYSKAQFRQLLDYCDIDIEVTEKLIDWLDSDSQPLPFGAEDPFYESLETPYRTANHRMTSPSELLLVAGLDAKGYQCLASNICALEPGTKINVNTAPVAVIAALSDDITIQDAEGHVEARPINGYDDVDEFLAEFVGIDWSDKREHLAVASNFFLGTAEAKVGKGEIIFHSLFKRSSQNVEVVYRSIGAY